MINDNHEHPSSPKRHLTVVDFPIDKIKVDPQKRLRQEERDYKNNPKYIALCNSIDKFGMRNPISVNSSNSLLVEGFWRLNVAIDLGWKTVPTILDYLTEIEALLLEYQENKARRDFNSYEDYIGVAQIKRKHEKMCPESKRGKYNRSLDTRQDQEIKIPSGGNMINNPPSFVDTYGNLLGLKKSALYNNVKIGEAILNKTFHPKTIKAIKEGRITQKQLLNKLRQNKNRKSIKDKLRNTPKIKPPVIKRPPIKRPEKPVPANETEKKLNTFQKIEKILDLKEEDSEIREQWNEVKSGKKSVDEAFNNTKKIIDTKNTIYKESKKIYLDAGEQYSNNKNTKISKPIEKKSKKKPTRSDSSKDESLEGTEKCKTCSKANNVAILCKKCNFPTPKVICDDDLANRRAKLRDPEQDRCTNAPEHEITIPA